MITGVIILNETKERNDIEQLLKQSECYVGGELPSDSQARLDLLLSDNHRLFIPFVVILCSALWVTISLMLHTIFAKILKKESKPGGSDNSESLSSYP